MIVLTTLVYRKPVTTVQPATNRPIEVKSDGYVGSDTCRSCHPHQHATWHASYHRTMTQVASPETVIPSFNKIAVKIDGLNYQLEKNNDKILAEMEFPVDREGSNTRLIGRPIVMTTGSHHMQIFWFPVDRHRRRMLGMFPIVYLKEQDRWIPRRAAFLTSERSIDIEGGRWNNTCIKCHATFGRSRPEVLSQSTTGEFTLKHDVFDSHVAELGIACESCHGPSEKHVKANRNPTFRYVTHLTGRDDASIVNPAKLSHRRTSEVCGQCHSVWLSDRDLADATLVNGFPYKPGEDLHKSKYRLIVEYRNRFNERTRKSLENSPGLLETTLWSDGMVQCHLDKTLAWTSQYLSDWYGIESPKLSEDEQSIAASVIWSLSGDAGQRALMAWSFGWREARETTETDWTVPYLAQLLEDPYPAVRIITEQSLRTMEGYETISYDFWAPTDQLAAGKLRVIEIWEKRLSEHSPSNPSILIGQDSKLMTTEFQRLLKNRDDRPVNLAE